RLEAVRETFGHVEHELVLFGQLDAKPLLEGGRIGAQINDDIVERAARAAHEFCLRVGRVLKVHAAQCAFAPVARDVALDNRRGKTLRRKLARRPSARKKTALVLESLRLDHKRARQFRLDEDHFGYRWQREWQIMSAALAYHKRARRRQARSSFRWRRRGAEELRAQASVGGMRVVE